jgi:hypothetical protein
LSSFATAVVACACDYELEVPVVRGLNAVHAPQLRDALVRGELNRVACPLCGAVTAIDLAFVYTDFRRGHYIAVEPLGTEPAKALERHRETFRRCFDGGPEGAAEIGASLRCRLVFGRESIREKLALWDAGLDDYVMEAVKGDVLCGAPGHGYFSFRYPVADQLMCETADDGRLVTVPRSMYDERAADLEALASDHPGLGRTWLVDQRWSDL